MTTSLTRPATTFFVSQMKKNLSKTTTTRLLPSEEMGKKHKATMHKNKHFSVYIYFIDTV